MGLDLPMLTLTHVVISLLGIVAGGVVTGGLLVGARLPGWTALFLITTIFTSASGFLFPAATLLPSHIVGALSLLLLAVCVFALYVKGLQGRWRTAFAVTAVASLYFNVFVLVVQLFIKTPALAQLAPTQQEPPFALTQGVVLLLFIALGWAATRPAAR